jgi:radical SAM superfamily enzyme YgiQ (UPF0313 family)
MLADGVEDYEGRCTPRAGRGRHLRRQLQLPDQDVPWPHARGGVPDDRRGPPHGARVIVAGSDASDHPDAFLAAGADAVLIGEGIAALIELIERLERDPDIDYANWVSGIRGRRHADRADRRN